MLLISKRKPPNLRHQHLKQKKKVQIEAHSSRKSDHVHNDKNPPVRAARSKHAYMSGGLKPDSPSPSGSGYNYDSDTSFDIGSLKRSKPGSSRKHSRKNQHRCGRKSSRLHDEPKLSDGINPTFQDWEMGIDAKFEFNEDHFDNSKTWFRLLVACADVTTNYSPNR